MATKSKLKEVDALVERLIQSMADETMRRIRKKMERYKVGEAWILQMDQIVRGEVVLSLRGCFDPVKPIPSAPSVKRTYVRIVSPSWGE